MAGGDNARHPSNPYPYTLPGVMIEPPNIQDPYGYLAPVYNNDPAIVRRITDLETRLTALQEKSRIDGGALVEALQVTGQMESHVRALERDRNALADYLVALEAQVNLLGAWREVHQKVHETLRDTASQPSRKSLSDVLIDYGLLPAMIATVVVGFVSVTATIVLRLLHGF